LLYDRRDALYFSRFVAPTENAIIRLYLVVFFRNRN
jgi:hypothetical protein